MYILITGASGFLGKHLIAQLGAKHSISPFMRGVYSTFPNPISFEHSWRHIDAVIHCAALYGRNNETEAQITEANVNFGHRVLDKSIQDGIKVFLNVGTSLPKETSIYAKTKAQFIEEAWQKTVRLPLAFIDCRCEQFYGKGDANFLGYVAHMCRENQDIPLTEGIQKRDLIYIDDLIFAFGLLLEASLGNPNNFTVDVGTGLVPMLKDVVIYIHTLLKSKSRLLFGERSYRENEPMFTQADITLLKKMGFKVSYPYQEGIKHWLQQEGWL